MSFSLVYLANRAIYRLGDFCHHWYVDAPRYLIHAFISKLEDLDKGFAFKVTLKHFGEPLYKDYSVLGRILGIIFRTGRLTVGGLVYLLFFLIFAIVFLVWLLVPIALVGYALLNLRGHASS